MTWRGEVVQCTVVSELRDIATDADDATSRRASRFAYAMRALGKDEPPKRLWIGSVEYRRTKVIKHDFFAATAFYESSRGKAVLKAGRTEPFMGFGLSWIGEFLLRRELRFYWRLRDLPQVPKVLATWGRSGFLHEFVPGAPLSKQRRVPDGFIEQLQLLIDTLHDRGIAYVDTNKPENILHGDDDRPHLIDFQISFDIDAVGRFWPMTALLRMLARADAYHVLKHKRRFRPDLLTDDEKRRLERRSWPIRVHRFLTRPYFLVRRGVMGYLHRSGKVLDEGSK